MLWMDKEGCPNTVDDPTKASCLPEYIARQRQATRGGHRRRHFVIANTQRHYFVVAYDGRDLGDGGKVYIWDSCARCASGESKAFDCLQSAPENMGLTVLAHCTGHQICGWRCGYFALWYLVFLAHTDSAQDLGQLEMPPMPDQHIWDIQRAIREHQAQKEAVVAKMLAAWPGAPKKVSVGEKYYVLRWANGNATGTTLYWEEARVYSVRDNKVVWVKMKGRANPRQPIRMPVAHMRAWGDIPKGVGRKATNKDSEDDDDER